jgi:hypothetical protein
MEYCQRKGRIMSVQDWVLDDLNPKLPGGDKFSVGSVSHWLHGGRNPDGKNISRMVSAFGPEVMPYLGIKMPADLEKVIGRWDEVAEEDRQVIMDIIDKPNPEPATLQV